MGKKNGKSYRLALSFRPLTQLYDPLIRVFMPEGRFKSALIEEANIRPGDRVLDFGCGTATLSIIAKRGHPDSDVTGVDVDEKVLDIARRKAARQGIGIRIDLYDGGRLPYGDGSFERVVSSLVMHHLAKGQKVKSLREIHRVLKPGGEIHIADFGPPRNPIMSMLSFILSLVEPISDNIKGMIPHHLESSGFVGVKEGRHFNTMFGTISLYSAKKPELG
ncbi:hypothetical protein A3K63_03040 [Candidatus Micrarchaeota archaeon RBG_16_49_10]|nr:MAG: hypothetical protein A3K63_03040 [Candidatus Micrarchaeota archaeon RBG_16_49_10]